jgi:MFS family permease
MTAPRQFYGWKLLAVLWLLMFASSLPMFSASVINAYMAAALHFDRTTLGFAFAVHQWVAGVPGLLVAFLINRRGVRFTVTLGAFLMAIGALLMATVVHSSWQVNIVFGFVIGLGVCTAGPIGAQTAAARWFVKRKALAIALLLTGPSICGFVAPPLANRVIESFHGVWRSGWWLVAGICAAATVLAAVFVRETPADLGQLPDGGTVEPRAAAPSAAPSRSRVFRTAEPWTFAEVLRSPVLWLICLSSVGFVGGYFMFLAHGVVHLRDLGYSPAQAAFSIAVLSLAQLGGTLLAGALGDYIEPRLLMAVALLLIGTGILLALKASGPLGLYVYAVFLGVGAGGYSSPSMTLPANYFGVKSYASVMGLLATIATTLAAVATYSAGYIYDHFGSYSRFFIPVGGMCFVGFVILLFVRPPRRKPAEPIPLAVANRSSKVEIMDFKS